MTKKQKRLTRRDKKTLKKYEEALKNSAIAFASINKTVENLRELTALLELKTREEAYKFLQNTMDRMPVSKPFKLQWQGKNYNVFIKSKQECSEKLDQINNQLTALENPAT